MTVQQYDQFREVIRQKGYKQCNYPNTIKQESWYFYKGFAYTDDGSGNKTPGYQVIFLVYDMRDFRVEHPVPKSYTMGVTPLILTGNNEYERINLEITANNFDVEKIERLAQDFYEFITEHK